jgi:Fur family ferric uptake transcriptional regulator
VHVTTEDLIDALRNEGLRVTAARRAICAVLAEAHEEHLTAADIVGRASSSATFSIDASTVYRTLEVFERLGYLHHVHLGHGPGVVHLTDETDHHHLVCDVCGRTVDIPVDEMRSVFAKLGDRYGFIPDSVHFALVGTCAACAGDTG